MTGSKRFNAATLILLALLASIVLPGCSPRVAELGGQTMGTTWSVKVVDSPASLADLQRELEAALVEVNARMSTYDPDSELMQFNNAAVGEPFPVSETTLAVVRISDGVSISTAGAFDVTVGPLVNLWGFGPRKRPERVPSQVEIENALGRIGYSHLQIVGKMLVRHAPLFVDLSAVAKGYAVDVLADVLRDNGVERFLVEIGGELRGQGLAEAGRPWRVAIEAPIVHAREVYRVVELRGMGLATSGDYRNYFEVDGQRFSHMIDPRTGRPIKHNVASVSVLHPSVAHADAWATALNVLGVDAGMAVAEREGLLALFILRDDGAFVTRASPAFDAYVRNIQTR